MSSPANITDVQARFERPLTPGEESAAATWLDDAWVILRREIPGIATRMSSEGDTPGHLDVEEIVTTLSHMVVRVLRNPDGLRTWNEDTYGQTVDNVLSTGQLYVTDVERARLMPTAGPGSNGIYSIQLGR